ncbi:MAG: hypothetical protein AAGC67_02550 [Myxococcota bacterium]
MRCSASSSEAKRRPAAATRLPGERSAFERALAGLLVGAIVALTPTSGFAGEEFQSANDAVMVTPGTIDNTQAGITIIQSDQRQGRTDWRGGFDQPAENTLIFDLSADGAQHLNVIGGNQMALIRGRIESGLDDTILFAAPSGIYIGSTAVIDVGGFVAVGADLTDIDTIGGRDLELTGAVALAPGGVIAANEKVLLYGTDVLLAGEIYTPGGQLLAVGADSVHFLDADTITEGLTNPVDLVALTGSGSVQNLGELTAESAALIGRRVVNTGHIEIEDGTLMMIGGDAVRLVEFDNPVVVSIPRANGPDNHVEAPEYAVENRGTIDAGRGRVRLAAADALGWGIRQIAGDGGGTPSIRAETIALAGGENGRVEIAGDLDASDREAGATGGSVEVTGETIVLAGDVLDAAGTVVASGARLDASGDAGGGTILVGGDTLGKGELQRARGLVVAEGAEVRADAVTNGDGGRVVLFSESLTHVAGAVSARGGAEGGDGGFVETSGLERLSLLTTPDLSAAQGEGGHWLIDPFSIRLVDESNDFDCATVGEACLNKAVEAILDPNFDSAGFDDVLRTIDFDPGAPDDPNTVSVTLIARALAVGTDVTLSTEAFDPRNASPDEIADGAGDIDVEAAIAIPDGGAAPGTRATLTLLAAGSINVDADITVGSSDTVTPDLALDVILTANDPAQRPSTDDFAEDQIRGDVNLAADIRTGGGNFEARGVQITQSATSVIETDGGDALLLTGSFDRFGNGDEFDAGRNTLDPSTLGVTPGLDRITTGIDVRGTIDTSRPPDDGGNGGTISLQANSVTIRRTSEQELFLEAGELDVSGTLRSGGGAMSLAGGIRGTTSIGNARFTGATIESDGGAIAIEANRLDPEDTQVRSIDPVYGFEDDQGGAITFAGANEVDTEGGLLTIGHLATQSVTLEGRFDTRDDDGVDDGLDDGLLSVFAGDRSGFSSGDDRFGAGAITIGGTTADTTLSSAGITLESRDVSTETNGGLRAVRVEVTGESRQEITFDAVGALADDGDGTAAFVNEGTLRIEAERQASFAQNTGFRAERFDLLVAAAPSALTSEEAGGTSPDGFDPDLRLAFLGSGGASETAGVRIQADDVSIRTSPILAVTNDLMAPDAGDATDLARRAGADYGGLQLRRFEDTGDFRPETVSIVQGAGFGVVNGETIADNEIFFGGRSGGGGAGGVFDVALIGGEGQQITLESQSGSLAIGDAAGLNETVGYLPSFGDAGASRVTLRGGLLLDSDPAAPAVDFASITNPFDVTDLSISSPRDFTIDASVVGAISSVDELVITAGAPAGIELGAFDFQQLGGTLTVEAGLTLAASEALTLHGAASGIGDLEFDATGAAIRLASDAISIRAGAGAATEGSVEDRSEILGAASVEFRDGAGGAFVADGTEKSFLFRQDAAIDAATHLPTIDDFGIAGGAGFGIDPERVDYGLHSDFGTIDLTTGGFDAAQIRDVDLSLIGREVGSTAAIQVPTGFVFDGRSVTLGSTARFQYTTALADAFAPAGVAAATDKELTLRAGSEELGSLSFESGVVVRAPHVRLVAGDGTGGSVGARVIVAGATFDLTDGIGGDRSFVFHEDQAFALGDLPDADDFVSDMGSPVLPSILAIRNDAGEIDLRNPDFTALPLDLAGGPARLILEAVNVRLRATTDDALVLTSETDPLLANLRLRIRSNQLTLESTGGNASGGGTFAAGDRTGDTAGAIGPGEDADFDDERLLIEAFTVEGDATTTNLSEASEVEDDPGMFDLANGRGPTNIAIQADAGLEAAELIERFNVSGHLERGFADDEFGNDDPTNLVLFSEFNGVTVSSDVASGSGLTIGQAIEPLVGDVRFETGAYTFGQVGVVAEGDVTLAADTDIDADSIRLEAGFLDRQPFDEIDAANPMGNLIFEGLAQSDLRAREIVLRAGPTFRVTNRDFDGDGQEDRITEGLADIDFTGLRSLDYDAADTTPGPRTIVITESDELDTTEVLQALALGGNRFELISLASIQSETIVTDDGALALRTEGLVLGLDEDDASLTVNIVGAADAAPFSSAAGFDDVVELRSNDITIDVADGLPQIQLDDANLRIVSRSLRNVLLDDPEDTDRVASDQDVLERVRLTIVQEGDFSTTTLPRLDRYFQRGFEFGSTEIQTDRREDLRFVEIVLETNGPDLTFTNALRDGTIGSNLVLAANGTGGRLDLAVTDFRPGVSGYAFESLTDLSNEDLAAIELASFETTGFAEIAVPDFAPTRTIDNETGLTETTTIDFGVETVGDQRWAGDVLLAGTLDAIARDVTFGGDVFRDTALGAPIAAGLLVQARGEVIFEGNLGSDGAPTSASDTPVERLGFLAVLFDDDADGTAQFGVRMDDDNDNGMDDGDEIAAGRLTDPDFELDGDLDTIAETVEETNQFVFVEGPIAFATLALGEPNDPTVDGDTDPAGDFLAGLPVETGRIDNAPVATIGKASGDLTFRSTNGGDFVMGSGERLAVAGDLTIDHAGSRVTLGDVAAGGANGIRVIADAIDLVGRNAGVSLLPDGASTQDGGPAILANTLDFGGVVPQFLPGTGKRTRFGFPDAFDPTLPAFLAGFPVAAISTDGTGLDASDFQFVARGLSDQVASPFPRGPSRSELTGAVPPLERALLDPVWRDLAPIRQPARLAKLGVDARETAPRTLVARLEGGAILDDLGLAATSDNVPVTESRLDPADAEAAIDLYESLFGAEGERAPEVRATLQDALDQYRAQTRVRRVVGFELRRFVKNRPSTLLEAYGTLDELDALFRYHRRLGLSRGEFRVIQREWLKAIQPDGITLEELSEAIHPSRYVRGSDILDIFGR